MLIDPAIQLTAMDDPVPAQSAIGVCGDVPCDGHNLETKIQRWLLQHPGLKFSALVVRRVPDGVCIEGLLESDEGSPDLDVMLGPLPGVDRIVNLLQVIPCSCSNA